MEQRPIIHCLVARIAADGWVGVESELYSLSEAFAKCQDDSRFCLLVDPHDEIALAAWEREHRPPSSSSKW